MKIGIMSMQRIPNLGSFMQAYGLKKTIEAQGHEVVFIDVPKGQPVENKGYGSDKHNINRIYDKLAKIRYIVHTFVYKKKHFKYYQTEFQNYLKEYLGLKDEEIFEDCDVLVVGSDEMFNCLNSEYGFTMAPFGKYEKAKKIITYAASCGWTRYEYLNKAQIEELEKSIVNLSAISVRDLNTKAFISEMTTKSINMHLDPVLVSDYSDFFTEPKNPVVDRPYILVYAYYNRISDKKHIKEIKQLAKKHGCITVSVGSPQFWCDEYLTISPANLLSLFRNAKFVVTDTFHGTIFSIISQSQFGTIIRKSNNNKLSFLLDSLKLENRIVSGYGSIEELFSKKIDYTKTINVLEQEKVKTREYLQDNLSNNANI